MQGRGSPVVRVSDRGLPCHEFEPSTTKDPPCGCLSFLRNDSSHRDIQYEVSGVTFGSLHLQIQSTEIPHVIGSIVPVRGYLNLFKL
ncbi:hypothetical protein TNCV_5035151 [Trichonephila clavipes]|nr:hypothetical protein TNCV_5035151 [Trichonephila clavipes]